MKPSIIIKMEAQLRTAPNISPIFFLMTVIESTLSISNEKVVEAKG